MILMTCQDGWTAITKVNSFLAAETSRQNAMMTTTMEDNQAAGSPRQIENFSTYINKNKGSEFIA